MNRENRELESQFVSTSTLAVKVPNHNRINTVAVEICRLRHAVIPTYESIYADGCDVRPCFDSLIYEDAKLGNYKVREDAGNNLISSVGKYGASVEYNQLTSFDYKVRVTLHPGERALIPTGIYVALPVGWEIQVKPKSGLALKQGISIVNTPGTVDSDYRGEIGVILENRGKEDFVLEQDTVNGATKIAQISIKPSFQMNFIEVLEYSDLSSTARGEGGFGSTGK